MALIVTVQANSTTLHVLVAQRGTGTTDPDSVGWYATEAITYQGDRPVRNLAGEVEHRYGDGALVLVARMLAAHGITP